MGQFRAFNLGNQACFRASFLQQAAGNVHVFGGAYKRHRDIIGAQAGGGFDVLLVFLGQGFGGEAAAALVEALVVGQGAADKNAGGDAGAVNGLDFHLDAAVVQYQDVAWLDVFNQLLVVNADALFIAGFLVHAGVQDKLLAGLEGHLVFREACDTKFWPLEVGEQGDKPAVGGGRFPHPQGALDVVFRTAVGKIQSRNINTCSNNS